MPRSRMESTTMLSWLVRERGAGNPPATFDERGVETELRPGH